jgi:hypothetical protein
MSEVYAITDLDGYATQMRDAAAKSLTDNSCEDNLDDFMSISQLVNLVKSECLGFDDENRPLFGFIMLVWQN